MGYEVALGHPPRRASGHASFRLRETCVIAWQIIEIHKLLSLSEFDCTFLETHWSRIYLQSEEKASFTYFSPSFADIGILCI